MSWEIRQGDCLDLLRAVPDGSVDCVVIRATLSGDSVAVGEVVGG